MLKKAAWLFYIELLLLWRRSQEWLYPLSFFVIVISLFPLAFTPDPAFLQKYIPGAIWIAALLASLLSVETIFHSDLEDGYLEQVILSPAPLAIMMIIKCGALWFATELPLILLTPIIGLLFHLSAQTIFTLCISLLIGTPILTLLGSLCVSLTLGLRQQGSLLGLLILPLATPVLIFGVNMVQEANAGFSILGAMSFLSSLTILAILFLPFALAVTLRVSVDD